MYGCISWYSLATGMISNDTFDLQGSYYPAPWGVYWGIFLIFSPQKMAKKCIICLKLPAVPWGTLPPPSLLCKLSENKSKFENGGVPKVSLLEATLSTNSLYWTQGVWHSHTIHSTNFSHTNCVTHTTHTGRWFYRCWWWKQIKGKLTFEVHLSTFLLFQDCNQDPRRGFYTQGRDCTRLYTGNLHQLPQFENAHSANAMQNNFFMELK